MSERVTAQRMTVGVILALLVCLLFVACTSEETLVRVPNVVGMTFGAAKEQLANTGLEWEARGLESDRVVVVSQTPTPGGAVQPGSTVTLSG